MSAFIFFCFTEKDLKNNRKIKNKEKYRAKNRKFRNLYDKKRKN